LRNSGAPTPVLEQCFDSNARLAKGPLTIDGAGTLAVSGRPLVTSAGAIMRRADSESPEGFLVSPSGYVTIGGLNVVNTGQIVSTCNATFATVTAGNLTTLSNVGVVLVQCRNGSVERICDQL
jgi:uncharacterized Zn-binding protein involved in type VI secretion